MTAFLWLFLLLGSSSVDLVDDLYQIPAGDWRYVDVTLRQRPALLGADAVSSSGGKDVRVALLPRREMERLRQDRAHSVLASTTPGESGHLRYYLRDPGRYALVLDNRDNDKPAAVHLRAWLDFGAAGGPQATYLSPRRQLTVILISFAVFFAIATWSARRLLSLARR